MSNTVHVWLLAACLKLQVIHSLWLPPVSLTTHRKGQLILESQLLPAQGPGVGQQTSQGTAGCAFACFFLLAYHRLFLKGLLAKLGDLPLGEMPLRLRKDGEYVPLSLNHMSESVLDYFSELSRANIFITFDSLSNLVEIG